MRSLFSPLLALAAVTPVCAQSPQSVSAAVSSVTPADIIRRIGVIAHDSMRGRSTPSPELDKVAAFIGGEFRKFGLKPGGDSGRFIQRYALRAVAPDTVASGIAIAGGPRLRVTRDALPPAGAADASVQ